MFKRREGIRDPAAGLREQTAKLWGGQLSKIPGEASRNWIGPPLTASKKRDLNYMATKKQQASGAWK